MRLTDEDSEYPAYDNEDEASREPFCYAVQSIKIKGIIYYIPTFE